MYIQPQLQVFQEFNVLPPAAVANLNAFVFGPNYVLRRYANSAIRADLFAGVYTEGEQYELSYPMFPGNAVIDAAYTRLYLENVKARYARISENSAAALSIVGNGNSLQADPVVGTVEQLSTSEGVELEIGGSMTSTPAVLPDDLYIYPTTAPWVRVAEALGLQPTGGTLAVQTGLTGSVSALALDSGASVMQSGVTVTGPFGLVFDFDTPAEPRRVFKLTYTGQPVSGESLTIGTDVATVYDDFQLGATAAETYANLAAYLYANVDIVEAVIPMTGAIAVVLSAGLEAVSTDLTNATLAAPVTFNALRAPVTMKIQTATGRLELSPDMRQAVSYFDSSLAGVPVTVELATGAIAGTEFDSATRTLTVSFEDTDTLDAIRSAINAVAGNWVRVTSFGNLLSTEAAVTVEGLPAKTVTTLVPDLYKVHIGASQTVFADGNGGVATGDFAARNVETGDAVTVRYVDGDGELVTKQSRVVAVQGIPAASSFQQPAEGAGNAASQFGDSLTLNPGTIDAELPQVVDGSDNQLSASGPLSGIFYLEPGNRYVRADYATGDISPEFTVRITTQGAPGVARATVLSRGGAQQRTNVPVLAWADDTAAIELGSNLWMRLDAEVPGAETVFRIGDTYSTSRGVNAPWSNTLQAFSAEGNYTGLRDTTYIASVVSGGTFTQSCKAYAGLQSASSLTIAAAGSIALELGGEEFTGTLSAVAAAVNEADVVAQAAIVSGDLVLRGAPDVIRAATVTGASSSTLRVAELVVSPVYAVTGDKHAEYKVRCVTGGSLQIARFAVEGTDGLVVTSLSFPASGTAVQLAGSGISVMIDTMAADGVTETYPVFRVGDSWTIALDAMRPRVRISDTAGVDQARTVTVSADSIIPLGVHGLQLRVAANSNTNGFAASSGGLLAGDAVLVTASASKAGVFNRVRLADTIGPVSAGVLALPRAGADFNLMLDSVSADPRDFDDPGSYTWLSGEDSVHVNGNLKVAAPGIAALLPVESARMYINYRALSQAYTDGIYSMPTIGGITAELGEIHPDNPLAQGLHQAMLNSTRPVYYAATPSDDLAGYQSVLELAANTAQVYSMAPMTRDQAVLDMVAAHTHAMSAEDVKQWRIAIVGVQTDSIDTLVTGNATLTETDDGLLVVFPSGTELMGTVGIGDTVSLGISADAWGARIADTYRVTSVESNTSLRVVPVSVMSGVITSVPEPVEVTRVLSNLVRAARVAARSSSFASRRVYSVFPESFEYNGLTLTAEFAAAAVAGLVSAMAPQRPLTNSELVGLGVFENTFNRADLNTMAEGGTFILAQEAEGGRTYVRHQISTQSADGNLLTSEMSVTKNLDAASYYLANLMSPFHGRYNITEELIQTMEVTLTAGLDYLTSSKTGAGLLGPMLLTEGTAVREVSQHPTMKDHVIAIADLGMPIPNNVTQLRLVV